MQGSRLACESILHERMVFLGHHTTSAYSSGVCVACNSKFVEIYGLHGQ